MNLYECLQLSYVIEEYISYLNRPGEVCLVILVIYLWIIALQLFYGYKIVSIANISPWQKIKKYSPWGSIFLWECRWVNDDIDDNILLFILVSVILCSVPRAKLLGFYSLLGKRVNLLLHQSSQLYGTYNHIPIMNLLWLSPLHTSRSLGRMPILC